MTPDKPEKKLVTVETARQLTYLFGHLDQCTEWEKNLVMDRAGALKQFRANAVLTDKQTAQIASIYRKVQVNCIIDGVE